MALFDNVFKSGQGQGEEEGFQLPMNITHEAFGEVNVRPRGNQVEIDFTVLIDPSGEENWQTGVALDASESMAAQYGRLLDSSKMPKEAWQEYAQRNQVQSRVVDGQTRYSLTQEGLQDAQQKGYIAYTKNLVEPIAREFVSYLAGNLDADGGTTLAYWACGERGDEYEVVGDFTEAQCRSIKLRGPQQIAFGKGTRLTPIARYFVDRFKDAQRGIYVFITDGRLDDMQELMDYTWQLARARAAGQQNMVKFVLIGVGRHVDEEQMAQLDDMLDDSGLKDSDGNGIDIWDHKIAEEMRSMLDLFAEVVNENQIIAPTAKIFDDQGRVVLNLTNGLMAKTSFTMPASSKFFELEIDGNRIRQSVVKE